METQGNQEKRRDSKVTCDSKRQKDRHINKGNGTEIEKEEGKKTETKEIV